MPKKACCCNPCEWCNHDHYRYDYYNPRDPVNSNNGANLLQDTQPNWKITGTLTTELPSIGHPMTRLSFVSSNPCSNIATPLPVGTVLSESGDGSFINTLRTPISDIETTSYGWGESPLYGDLCPAWFNGINMTNVLDDTDIFFKFTFQLKIEKQTSSGYTTIININRTGPGKNLRPHPDACHSYNVNDINDWELASGCGVFHERVDNEGNPLPCTRDFARMPRGPWPYRFAPHLDVDNNDLVHCYNSEGYKYTKEEVKGVQNGTIAIGTPRPNNEGKIEANILQCALIQKNCGLPQPNQPNCCPSDTYKYIRGNQYCDRLDPDHGTPFGWEDCPELCAGYSNSVINGGSVDPTNLNFFGWISPVNRYTTPEWDLYEGVSGSTSGISGGTAGAISKKISLHVLVPTQFDSFCYPQGAQGQGFGEWCFGMDYEAPQEIEILENAGYIWSDGREQDGIWINKTPTDALRVLFTLDHSDLNQGKVWRVFRDWDVSVNQLIKTFNAGTAQETKFKITIKQKVEEVQFSSLGCDCPSGYNIIDGKVIPIEPSCGDHINEYGPEALYNVCWGSLIDGKYDIDGNISSNIGGRVSFSERGPIVIKMKAETDNTGCQICNESRRDGVYPKVCDHKFGSKTNPNNVNADGQLFIVNASGALGPTANTRNQIFFADAGGVIPNADTGGPSCLGRVWIDQQAFGACNPSPVVNQTTSKFYNINPNVYDIYRDHGARFNTALADIPLGTYNARGAGIIRYRSAYNAVQQSESSIANELYWQFDDGSTPSYTHLYGDFRCTWNGGSECSVQGTPPVFTDIYRLASVFIDRWPNSAPVGNCRILCPCGAKGTVSTPQEGQDPEDPNDPCSGWSGPTPCPYYGGWCGGAGGYIECPCENNDNAENRGPYLFPSYGCSQNVVPIYGKGAGDIFYKCSPIKENGEFSSFCNEPFVEHYMGIDSERIFFTAPGQVTVWSGVGDPGCAKTCTCIGNQNTNSSCYWTDQFGTRRCNFCEGPATEIGFGYQLNTFINWKKYLCRKRYEDGYKIPVDIMSNFEWSCNASSSGNCDRAKAGLTTGSNCDYGWLLQNCELQNVPLFSMSEWGCLVQESMNLNPSYRISLSKYNIDESNPDWCFWDTTYQPNPARTSLPNGRNHITINAKGPI
jgi:hypothetical protein